MAVKKRPGMMLYFEDLESLYRLDDVQLGVLVRTMAAYAQAGDGAALAYLLNSAVTNLNLKAGQ